MYVVVYDGTDVDMYFQGYPIPVKHGIEKRFSTFEEAQRFANDPNVYATSSNDKAPWRIGPKWNARIYKEC